MSIEGVADKVRRQVVGRCAEPTYSYRRSRQEGCAYMRVTQLNGRGVLLTVNRLFPSTPSCQDTPFNLVRLLRLLSGGLTSC